MQKTQSQTSFGSNSSLNNQTPKKTLEDALHSVKVNSFHMKKYLDQQNTSEAITYASNMLTELGHHPNSSIDPKQYYELYMAIFDELRHLQSFLQEHCLQKDIPASIPPSPTEPENFAAAANANRDKLNSMQIHKSKLAELYEFVQYTTGIIPRMYLLITVGSVYMTQPNSPRRDLLVDMLDMCKGVQHPMRGLFLRYYLLQAVKNLLPSSEEESLGEGSFKDTLGFLLQNFTEMNKLWVRLQYQGHSRDRQKREQERKELRLLVGSNLVRLSQLETLNLEVVLPKVLEQVVSCKDVIAQEYLMEAIIQVFQDDFHLRTLDLLLEATGKLHPQVNVKNILIAFVDRHSAFAKRELELSEGPEGAKRPSILKEIPLFDIFWQQVSAIIKNREELTLEDVVALLHSLANFSMSCYPDKIAYYDKILTLLQQKVVGAKSVEAITPATARFIMAILTVPLKTYASILTLLKNAPTADRLSAVIAVLPYSLRHSIAMFYINAMLEGTTLIADPEYVSRLLGEWLSPLIKDQPDNPGTSTDSIDNWRDEQVLVAKFVHLLKNEDPDQQFLILSTARKFFNEGGPNRILFTLPPLVNESLKLGRAYRRSPITAENTVELAEKKRSTLFKFMHQTVTLLQQNGHFAVALQLFLAPISDPVLCYGHEMIAYEFVVQAFTIYEESISDSKTQIALLHQMIGVLFKISNSGVFTAENYDPLVTKCTLYAAKLLKKEDQCRLVLCCAALFWGRDMTDKDLKRVKSQLPDTEPEARPALSQPVAPVIPELEASPWADEPETQTSPAVHTTASTVLGSPASIPGVDKWLYRDGKRVLECLQKSLKIADSCMDSVVSAQLFVEILNYYIFHFEKDNPAITVKYVNGLIDLVYSNIQTLHSDPAAQNSALSSPIEDTFDQKALSSMKRIERFFLNTLKHLQTLKAKAASASFEEKQRWESVVIEEVYAGAQEW